MLSEEKTKSILVPPQDITLLLDLVISSCRDLVSAFFEREQWWKP